jgi:hypothetical protein
LVRVLGLVAEARAEVKAVLSVVNAVASAAVSEYVVGAATILAVKLVENDRRSASLSGS